jgi:hypothetical protein
MRYMYFYNLIYNNFYEKSLFSQDMEIHKNGRTVLARQPSRAADPLLRSLRGGGEGDPLLCIGKQEVGTYIYSLLYTHTLGSWDDFFEVLLPLR